MVSKKNKTVLCGLSFMAVIISVLIMLSFSAFSALQPEIIELKYDDYYTDFENIEITDAGVAESFKVGFGVPEGTKDDCVISVEDGALHAVGIGSARVVLDGTEYTVTVEAAPVSMFLLMGQSNMTGVEGNADQSVKNKRGTVYSTVIDADFVTAETAPSAVPSTLSGQGSEINCLGTTENLSDYPVNLLTEDGGGKMGIDSAVAYKWHSITSDKVWVINITKGGSAILKWQKGTENYNRILAAVKSAQQIMKKEILAGHYILKDYGYFWLQGCSDRANSAEHYAKNFLLMHEGLKKDLSYDIDGDGKKESLGFCNMILPRKAKDDCLGYRYGIYEDTTDKSYYESFYDLEMSGSRVAQYWLCNNPEYEDINLVCNIGDSWVYMPDGSNGVKEYFASRYENGRVDYPVQVLQNKQWYCPETPADVHDSAHYNQIGYNEVGFEAAQNTAYLLSRAEKPDVETRVTFYDWTGYREVSSLKALSWAESSTLVVPVVYPVYESKSVTYKLSDNLDYKYYDLTAKYGSVGGELISQGADINGVVTLRGKADVAKGEGAYYYKSISEGLNAVSDDIYTENPLTAVSGTMGEGKVENGIYSGMIYRMQNDINLLHNKPWLVEWKGKSEAAKGQSQSLILLSESNSRKNYSADELEYFWLRCSESGKFYITLGKSNSIGGGAEAENITLKVNPRETHTYRLWNEINADGSNSICVSVDGVMYGRYTSQSGKDLVMRYIGAKSYELSNYSLEWIKIAGKYNCSTMGHALVYSTTDPTCTKDGKITVKCIYCDYSEKTVTPKLGHKLSSEYTSDGNATYLNDGTKSRKCVRCSYKKTVTDKGSKLVLSYPKTVKSIADESTVTLSWSKCKDASGYRIYMNENGRWKPYKTTKLTAYTMTGFSSASNYSFAVRAYKKVGSTTVWAPKYKKISVLTLPDTPEIRTQSSYKGRAEVMWDDISGETGYQVWYSESKSGKYTKLSNCTENTVRYKKKGLDSGKKYYFKVRAYIKTDKGYVYSAYSSVKSLKIK